MICAHNFMDMPILGIKRFIRCLFRENWLSSAQKVFVEGNRLQPDFIFGKFKHDY